MEDNHKKHYHYTPVLLEHSALNSIRTEMHRFGCYSAERKIRPCRFAYRQNGMYCHHTGKQLSTPAHRKYHRWNQCFLRLNYLKNE
jgi:hypothetical protein